MTTPHDVFESMRTIMINLYGRWLDEREYEDIADYEKVLKSKVEALEDIRFGRMYKRPFGFTYFLAPKEVKAMKFRVSISMKKYSMKAVSDV